jgi:AcrR family transcriptional regulator
MVPRGELAERLIAATLALLADAGTDAISLRAVARAAGVSAMAPYRHFADKEALLAAVAAHGFAGLRDVLAQADSAASDGDALVAQAVAYVGFALANPALFRLMFGPPRACPHPDLLDASNTAYGVLATRVAAQAPPAARDTMALGCWAFVHGMALLHLDGQLSGRADAPPDVLTRRVAAAMLALS